MAAVATFAAVIVALLTSSQALAEIKRSRKEDRQRELARSNDMAVRLAVVFHHELWLLGGELHYVIDLLQPPDIQEKPDELIEVLVHSLPTSGLSLLQHFADQLDVFERHTAAKLLLVLSGWNSIKDGPKGSDLDGAPADIIRQGAASTANTLVLLRTAIDEAMAAITPLAQEVRDDLPVANWMLSSQ